MKKKRLLQIVCMLLLVCLTLCSCNSTKQYPKRILGQWQLSNCSPENGERYLSSYLVFSEDHTCEGEFGAPMSWMLLNNTLNIFSLDTKMDTITYSITSMNMEKMAISFTNNGKTYTAEYTRVYHDLNYDEVNNVIKSNCKTRAYCGFGTYGLFFGCFGQKRLNFITTRECQSPPDFSGGLYVGICYFYSQKQRSFGVKKQSDCFSRNDRKNHRISSCHG